MPRPAKDLEPTNNDPVEAPENSGRLVTRDVLATPKKGGLFPIRLLRNYRPVGKFTVVEPEDPENPDSPLIEREPIGQKEIMKKNNRGMTVIWEAAKEELGKVKAGTIVKIEPEEAQKLIDARIGVRADNLPLTIEHA